MEVCGELYNPFRNVVYIELKIEQKHRIRKATLGGLIGAVCLCLVRNADKLKYNLVPKPRSFCAFYISFRKK